MQAAIAHQVAARHTPEELGAAALQAFFGITARWGLSAAEQQVLLGNPPTSTFYKLRAEKKGRLSQDMLERISYVMGIHKSLLILLPDETATNAWVKKPNAAPLFGGKCALDKMLQGNVADLYDVRRYLDAERG
jgi:hypothetical protein